MSHIVVSMPRFRYRGIPCGTPGIAANVAAVSVRKAYVQQYEVEQFFGTTSQCARAVVCHAGAVSHSLCDVSEHEQAVSAALEQLFGHALDMLPSTLQLARLAVAMQGLKEARDAFDALLGSSSDS
jgi:hypothetical protein